MDKKYTIVVAGTGYVGLSIATLLSQDEYIEKYLAEKDIDLTAMLNTEMAYSVADFVVIAAPTNVYSTNRIDVASSKRACFAH